MEIGAALEHEMLEQVGGAGGAGDLVARAHAVRDHHGEHGRGVVLEQQHVEVVGGEFVFGDAAGDLDGGETRRGFGRAAGEETRQRKGDRGQTGGGGREKREEAFHGLDWRRGALTA